MLMMMAVRLHAKRVPIRTRLLSLTHSFVRLLAYSLVHSLIYAHIGRIIQRVALSANIMQNEKVTAMKMIIPTMAFNYLIALTTPM